ncbi:MAG: ABC transporter ATP-binding protein [Clostridia bacterium]|nr:ABC transporter ATP-binding protein [Clostridia bacterium]
MAAEGQSTHRKGVLGRLLRMLFRDYKWQLLVVVICVALTSYASTIASLYMNKFIAYMTEALEGGGWEAIRTRVYVAIGTMAAIYLMGWIASFLYNRLMAVVTQSFLNKTRQRMFSKMETLPLRYFDTHPHGDIMSYYTNDIDTLRELISRSMPQILTSALILSLLIYNMLYLSIWMGAVVALGVVAMFFVTKKIGGNSAKYFVKQQKAIAKEEAFVEEMMNGQKVVKVFCHEEQSEKDFDRVNDQLCEDATRANRYANILMPIMGNIGNILYVLIAFVGGVLIISGVENVSLSGQLMGIAVVVPFLNMTRQFTNNVSQLSQQVNGIVMAMAGARRIFELLDEEPERDQGYVGLVNAKIVDGELVECSERTGMWAWKHPHGDGTVTYTQLRGDVRIEHMDFGYVPEKTVLKDITLYAEPGQKVAFVGATGAGKTTITNLINRFYDIDDGKIRYDGININKIKKADLRRSLGVVLQDVNLFTGTVMENIRYGKLDATDEECIAAAKLAHADDFITRLPEGYNTMLSANGANLSQGQRQLISIARAAVADPPVMIMDEATSSIDTRTESLVQKGMDALMKGRTVFVIAHRLSTVRNSDVIMVLEQGRIIERGSHEKLIEEKGKYYQLYTGAFELE